MLIHARYLVNSFNVTVRTPPEILTMICSHFTTEDDVFSASRVCHHWRSSLISFPSLWTRFPCHHVSRTIISLERCRSVPIHLKFDPRLASSVALENVLLRGNKLASLTVIDNDDTTRVLPLHKLFSLPMESMERLHIYSRWALRREGEEQRTDSVWQHLLSLRELFVCRFSVPIGQFTAPNLIHLALENVGDRRDVTTGSILDMLRGSPLLETILIIRYRTSLQETTLDHTPVSLPNLRSIDLGRYEVCSGLITYLRFPQTVAAGFRSLEESDVFGDSIPPMVMASSRHVLGETDTHTFIIASAAPHPYDASLIRFERANGSLEITLQLWFDGEVSAFFGDYGGIISSAPRLDNVKELQLAECYIDPILDVDRLAMAMPNLTSICFFRCRNGDDGMFGLICPSGRHPSPPFPHLKHLTVAQPGHGLIQVAQERKKYGVPLQTVVIEPWPRLYTPEQIRELREFVDDVRVEIPSGVSGWSTGILDVWPEGGTAGPVSTT